MMLDNLTKLDFIHGPAAVTTDSASSALDLADAEGTVLIGISVAAGGTGTIAFSVTECDTIDGTYVAVPAAALFNPDTGAQTTIASVAAGASEQVIALKRDFCERYIKVAFDAGTTHTVSVVAAKQLKYANFSQS